MASPSTRKDANVGHELANEFPPATVTRAELLDGASDRRFRELVTRLITFSGELLRIREAIAAELGVSSPQFNILTAIALLEGESPNVSRIAQHLSVSVPFVVTESGALLRQGLIRKLTDPSDRRRVRLRLSTRGRMAIEHAAPLQRQVNDLLFQCLGRSQFEALHELMANLVASADDTLAMLVRRDAMSRRPTKGRA